MADIEVKRIPRIDVAKAGVVAGTRPRINFLEGSNVTLTITDDPGNNEVDVEIAASGGGGSPASPDKSVQFNNAGSFAGSVGFTFDDATNVLYLGDADAPLDAVIRASGGTVTNPNGVPLLLRAGEGYDDGIGGNADGGTLNLRSGDAVNSGSSGSILITASGSDSGGDPVPGSVQIFGGMGNTNNGGSFTMSGGSSTDGDGGGFTLTSGDSTNASGGDISIAGGAGPTGGGTITISAGNSSGANAGDIILQAGSGNVGGNIESRAGDSSGTGSNGGSYTISAGYPGDTGDLPGQINLLGDPDLSAASVPGGIYLAPGYGDYDGTKSGDVLIELDGNGTTVPGLLRINNLPTSDPGVSGALWIDTGAGNVLKVSP